MNDGAAQCQVCFQAGERHFSVPHVNRRKPDLCQCGHERHGHRWWLPCECRASACSCAEFEVINVEAAP